MKNNNDSKKQLIKTARKLFESNGYDQTSIRQIYSEAGLSNGTFYHYFKKKEDLLVAVCDADADVYDLVDDIENKVMDPFSHLYKYFLSYAKYWNDLGYVLAAEAYRLYDHMFLNEDFSKKKIHAVHTVAAFIEQAQMTGTFDKSFSSHEAAEYLFMTTRGILYEWTLRKGSFDLIEAAEKYVPRIIFPLIKNNTI